MKILSHEIDVRSRSDRIELFFFGDTHIGKRNCAEECIRKQIREVMNRAKRKDRQVRVLFGGDICDYVKMGDIKRFNVNALADWLCEGSADQVRKRLNDVSEHQVRRAIKMFEPLKPYAIGGLEGNHEYSIMHHNNFDMQERFCQGMAMPNLTDEVLIRFRFKRGAASTTCKLYMQHGFGGGRTAGAEPNKLHRLRDEWEDADVVLRGHSHTFHVLPPKPILFVPNIGRLGSELFTRHRYAANWGCWLHSHLPGPSSYESRAAYPARPMMTLKVVIWPFRETTIAGKTVTYPKIELREYALL